MIKNKDQNENKSIEVNKQLKNEITFKIFKYFI
jgi:hypothetical protein